MRIRAITPIVVTEDELGRRQSRYHRLSPPGVLVDLWNLPEGPRRLETDDDVRASDRLVAEVAVATDPTRYDLVLPDCVLDPGVDAGAGAAVPVAGILRLTAGALAGLGWRFSAVTRNRAIGDELVRRLERYGLGEAFAGLDVLDLDFEAVADDRRWHQTLRPVREAVAARGVGAIVNGCSAVEVPGGGRGAAVVDPTRMALDLIGVAARGDAGTVD